MKKEVRLIKDKLLQEAIEKQKNKVPIYKGCPNGEGPCYCTGVCQEVIGYRDKHPLEQ